MLRSQGWVLYEAVLHAKYNRAEQELKNATKEDVVEKLYVYKTLGLVVRIPQHLTDSYPKVL